MRASIADVAKRAQTSPMTVSNVLRGRTHKVSEATRQRVLQAVQELKYVPVRSSMQNRHIETRVIGLVFDAIDITQNYIAFQTYCGLQQGARQFGYDLMTLLRTPSEWMAGQEEYYFRDRRCDGFIFVNPFNREKAFETLIEQKIPAVACYSSHLPPEIISILPDDKMAMRQAVEHLKQNGHSRIAHVTGANWHSDMQLRAEGFTLTMKAAGFNDYADCIFQGADDNWQVCLPDLSEFTTRGITAIICGIDKIALALWEALEEAGLSVPGDISLIGVDGVPEAIAKGLTTVVNPFKQIGFASVEALCQQLQGEEPRSSPLFIPMELVEGHSVAGL
jgi:DNA-binding LacI/PurR family transcriptional regulator